MYGNKNFLRLNLKLQYWQDIILLLNYQRLVYKKMQDEEAKDICVKTTERLLRYSYDVVIGYSKKALISSGKLGWTDNLRRLTWDHQPKIDPGRKELHFEHVNPLMQLARDFLNGSMTAGQCLKKKYVVWITKKENAILPKSNRPNGWKKCYKNKKIELILYK